MAELPTGTVTFLFTDIENSTRLWEQFPETMRAALAWHDSLLRQAIEDHGGRVVKARGDGFHAAFATAPNALQAALTIQRALEATPWDEVGRLLVRIALHSGAAEERDGDYFGPAVNRAARLLGATHGGQIVLSAATAQLLQDEVPPDVELRDLGVWRFKDLSRAETVYQVVTPDLRADFPPLHGLDRPSNNLPVPATSFIGREQEILEVERLLETNRLVTLIGAGGVGKTRLALQIAARQTAAYPDGVWLVELASLREPELVPHGVAAALNVPHQAGQPILTVLLNALREKHLLLVLDNCEHLIDACAHLADALLRSCPGVRLLATSREALGVAGELRWRVPSLATPDLKQLPPVGRLHEYECIRLFVDRAQLAVPGFTLDDENARIIAQICAYLDGIPLAIELAAARLRVLSPAQVLERLSDRFRLLKSDSRTVLPRQQTLQALVDWSYELLSAPERHLFDHLAVFADGFTLDAAEAIAAGDGIEPGDVLDLLTQLAEKSLIVVDDHGRERRFRLLVTLQQYAAKRLAEREIDDAVRGRHAQFFLELAESAAPRLLTSDHRRWRDRLEDDHDNLRAAVDWAGAHAPELAMRLCIALWKFWWIGGYQSEGQSRLTRLLDATADTAAPALRLRALYTLGNLSYRNGDYAAARERFAQVRARAEQLGDQALLADVLGDLGRMAVDDPDIGDATLLLNQSLKLAKAVGNLDRAALNYASLGAAHLARFDADGAEPLLQCALALSQQTDDQYGITSTLFYRGLVALIRDDYQTARLDFLVALRLCWEHQFVWPIVLLFEALGVVATMAGQPERAMRLAGVAAALRKTYALKPSPIWRDVYQQRTEPSRNLLGEARSAGLLAEGQAMTLEQAVRYALDEPLSAPSDRPPAIAASPH